MLQLHAALSIRFNVLQVVQPLVIMPTLIGQSLQNSDNEGSNVPVDLATLDEDNNSVLRTALTIVVSKKVNTQPLMVPYMHREEKLTILHCNGSNNGTQFTHIRSMMKLSV